MFSRFKIFLVFLAFSFTYLAFPVQASAVINNPAPAAKISFTFDDGYASAYTKAAPTLAKYGFTGTAYVTTGCIGMTTAPNNCRADKTVPYMSWSQVTSLKNSGWEIGSHTVTHPLLVSTDPEDQPTKLSPAQVTQELTKSKADLAAQGINVTSFASPYGDYDMTVLPEIAKYYSSHRGFADVGYNIHPHSDYIIKVQQVQENITMNRVKGYVDQAIANKTWLVLSLHDIKDKRTGSTADYDFETKNLDEIAAYVKSKQNAGLIQSATVSQALVSGDTNLVANGSFNNGIGDGWTTDGPVSQVMKDSTNRGSYPDSTNSLKMISTARNIHVFSPKVKVDASSTYILKNYLNVERLTSGGVNFYIDEYNASGGWISGQNKATERSRFVESLNFAYKPTSSTVAMASLQIGVSANSGITAYIDNVQWLSSQAPTPPPPAPTNLMPNGTFDGGISGGWRTDSTVNITHDGLGNGSPQNPQNSVKMLSGGQTSHLFSPLISVDSASTYNISSYLSMRERVSGEVGFYVDEYDANGNWISGQWKTGVSALGVNNVAFSYKPTSTNVKSASLQVIVTGNSSIVAYFDDVKWIKP